MTPAGFPHSDTPGSTLGCQLPRAYRRLLRPSSALDAKASTMCPSQLVTHTTNPTPIQQPHPAKQPGNRSLDHPTTQPTQPPARDQTRDAHNQATKNHKRDQGQSPQPRQHTNKQPHTPTGVRPQDARVHYPDLKQQPHTPHHQHASTHSSRKPGHLKPQGNRRHHHRQLAPDSSEPQLCVCQQKPPTRERARKLGLFPHI
jgi:hypothetical protein